MPNCFHLFILYSLFFNADKSNMSSEKQREENKNFNLSYMFIGMGSNMYEMQPVFKVNGTNFIYTSEEVWISPNVKPEKPDTLCMGNFRKSSIDSINFFIKEIKDSVIYKTNIRVMSGGIIELGISNKQKHIKFQLHNAQDSTAKLIVNILNTYIPENQQKLWISSFANSFSY